MSHESDLKAKHDAEDVKAKADEAAKPKRPKVAPDVARDTMSHYTAHMIGVLGRAVFGANWHDLALDGLIEDIPETPAMKADKEAAAKAIHDARAKELADAEGARRRGGEGRQGCEGRGCPQMSDYVFSGLWPYIERAAKHLGFPLARYGQTRTLWHCTQIQNALGQLPRMPTRESQVEAMAYVNAIRDSLACAIEGIDAAILDVTSELELPAPHWATEDETCPTPHRPSTPSAQTWAKLGTRGFQGFVTSYTAALTSETPTATANELVGRLVASQTGATQVIERARTVVDNYLNSKASKASTLTYIYDLQLAFGSISTALAEIGVLVDAN